MEEKYKPQEPMPQDYDPEDEINLHTIVILYMKALRRKKQQQQAPKPPEKRETAKQKQKRRRETKIAKLMEQGQTREQAEERLNSC